MDKEEDLFNDIERKIAAFASQGKIDEKYCRIFADFIKNYLLIASKQSYDLAFCKKTLSDSVKAVLGEAADPKPFSHFHKAERSPIDYYALGLDLFRPIVDMQHSTLTGVENLRAIETKIKAGENVFLFANHQSEADPQLLSLLLEKQFPKLAEDIIFVAGERVITDPLAIPFSRGRNLLCIYSKKYFSVHLEKKSTMLEHNKKSIFQLTSQLKEGSKLVYIALSGGRDRANTEGIFEIAPFDPQNVQLCRLLGNKAPPTSFHPLALRTYNILPPPDGLQVELGETRILRAGTIAAGFGQALDFTKIEEPARDKEEKKLRSAQYVWDQVNAIYQSFPPEDNP